MKVVSFGPAGPDYPLWYLLKVDSSEDEFLVHSNWVVGVSKGASNFKQLEKVEWMHPPNGLLRAGEEIEFEEPKVPVYMNTPYRFTRHLRRKSKDIEEVVV